MAQTLNQRAAVVASCFEPPAGQSAFDYVIDLTGEARFDRTEQVGPWLYMRGTDWLAFRTQIHISSTFQVARLLGLEAEKRKVKAYVRIAPATYESQDKGSHDEKEDVKPLGDMGIWMHESLRCLGAMKEWALHVCDRTGIVS